MTMNNDFASLGLADPLLRAIADTGYTTPTPIQTKAIPLVLAGGDLLAAAQTGTGKTAGFTLPVLQRLWTQTLAEHKPGRPRCLILTPTRELAAQVQESVDTYGRHLPLTSMVMFGGVNINPQIQSLRKRVDILVATPGRLLDHAGQKTVDLSGVEILVLDEADRMLDMGFIRDIRRILAMLPRQRQSLLFSATFSDEIRELANGLLNSPGCVEVARRNTTSELVSQSVYMIGQKQKRELLTYLVRQNDWRQVLVFTRTKHGANKLAEYLGKQGIASAAIHGNKSQSARTRALAQFKDGTLPVLVATDIAARGLDIDQLPHVINFELPNVPEDYVHRIGRTGRAGSPGHAISLVDIDETQHLAGIERLIKARIARVAPTGFVPSAGGEAAGPSEAARAPLDGPATAHTRRHPDARHRDTARPASPARSQSAAAGSRSATAQAATPGAAQRKPHDRSRTDARAIRGEPAHAAARGRAPTRHTDERGTAASRNAGAGDSRPNPPAAALFSPKPGSRKR